MRTKQTDAFEKFIRKKKFIKDDLINYPGLEHPELRRVLTEKINMIAEEFRKIHSSDKPLIKNYLYQIAKGLKSFNNFHLDTEDKERLCLYIEELMDIVDLESSDGLLNTFVYGFDPNGIQNN